MRVGTFIVVMFSTAFVFYLMGYNSIIFDTLIGALGTDEPIAQNILNQITNIFQGGDGVLALGIFALLGIAAVTSFVLTGSNQLGLFIVPLVLMAILMANFVVFPLSFMFDQTLPELVRFSMFGFLNLWLMLAIIGFIRGDSV